LLESCLTISTPLIPVNYAAGLRVNELTKLLVADVEVDERRLFLRDAKEAKDRYTLIDKGTAELLRPLVAGQHQDTVLFSVLDSRIRKSIKRAGEKTGLKAKFDALGVTLSPHTFRHAHATHLYGGGMEPAVIKKLLGHASVEQTMGYVACGPVDWREAYDRSHLLG
jgi:integrase/recombinase XerD